MKFVWSVITFVVLLLMKGCEATSAPSYKPSKAPTTSPSLIPTAPPTTRPSNPSPKPTARPTGGPTVAALFPTRSPTSRPTGAPTFTRSPTVSESPTAFPTRGPTSSNGDTFVAFEYTGALQTFTVPSGVTRISVTLVGASGGNMLSRDPKNVGGKGALITSELSVNPGEVYHLYVGGSGKPGRDLGGFNGGGPSWGINQYIASGGGATDFRAYPYTIDDRMIVAGGGGGSGGNCIGDVGGNGGYPSGFSGDACYPSGQGGSRDRGGFAGDNLGTPYYCTNVNRGEFFQGGKGCGNTDQTLGYGGGGGGGYFGGGGAYGGAGGGGSSYSNYPVLEAINGTNSGNGTAYIRYSSGSSAPTRLPTLAPSAAPSANPSTDPTATPSADPSASPSEMPSQDPTHAPSAPTNAPSLSGPTADPSVAPSANPTINPSASPSATPSAAPSVVPSIVPSVAPSVMPSAVPSVDPTTSPSAIPTIDPSAAPSAGPTANPSAAPSTMPSAAPSVIPSMSPSVIPTMNPSASPSAGPTADPSAAPSVWPTVDPSVAPSVMPSAVPSADPTVSPSTVPTFLPTASPSAGPTARPTDTKVRNLVLDVTQAVHNLDVASYNAQKAAYNVTFQQTIAATLEGITPEGVTDIEVTDKAATGRVWSNAGEVVPQCSLKYKLTMFDAQAEFDVFQAQLVEAVNTGMMDDHFRHYAGLHGIDNSSYFGEAQASLSGDRASSSALTGVMLAGIVIGVLLAISIGGFIVAFFLMQDKTNRLEVTSDAVAEV